MKGFHTLSLAIASALILVSCGKDAGQTPEDPESKLKVSGPKSSLISVIYAGKSTLPTRLSRPSSSLGAFVSLYLSQNHMMKVISALEGIDVQVKFAQANSIETDETFDLLQEYGTILQVDIIDMLNRSLDRDKAINRYLESLKGMNKRIEVKITELDERADSIKEERRAKKKEVREVEKFVRHALKEKKYAAAGPKQEELAKLESELAEIETKESQNKKIIKITKKLLKVGLEREEAIDKNREILISGLKVIEVPGLEDLGIVIEE
ncbi:MAG: hypothetical protein QF741_02460 [Candidatus Peribacteraceae bacterium]|jgi:hypothetical protein|nr:hypothetical protein [Candidatus Peribacteraceae bacterium]MDP7646271.1 hypothetical protein [Candidatus Peribacteraceae bacterium]